ncbi:MarR family winged helix-turn-helix transcriptional regulator [Pontiella sp.]|uniref:MarR family winged helix-turn-helix transcriptional regulator n=1 Tax=Pontiella sp. TaxID=2837462 RepID=UPI00356B5660
MRKTLLHILSHNGRLLEKVLEEELAGSRLHHGQGRILVNIKRAGEITQADLARRMEIKPSTITTMLKPLEQRKLVTRKVDPKTNRALLVSLTPAGRKACDEVEAAWQRIENRILRELPGVDLDDLFQTLETVLSALGGTAPHLIKTGDTP